MHGTLSMTVRPKNLTRVERCGQVFVYTKCCMSLEKFCVGRMMRSNEDSHVGARMNTGILRIDSAARHGGISNRELYRRQDVGLWPTAFKVGPRQRGFFAYEIDQLNAARAAGLSDDKVRALVKAFHKRRQSMAKEVEVTLREAQAA